MGHILGDCSACKRFLSGLWQQGKRSEGPEHRRLVDTTRYPGIMLTEIEGELVDLVEEFSDGRIQFAYVKVKDSNTGLPKNALIAWCGEGVPERTKGYFTSHLTAVSRLLHVGHTVHSKALWTNFCSGLPRPNHSEIRSRSYARGDHTESCGCIRLEVFSWCSSCRSSNEAHGSIQAGLHANTKQRRWWIQPDSSQGCPVGRLNSRCRRMGSRRTARHKNTVGKSSACLSANTS